MNKLPLVCLVLGLFMLLMEANAQQFEPVDMEDVITEKEESKWRLNLTVGDQEDRYLIFGDCKTSVFVDELLLFEVHNDTIPLEMLGNGRLKVTLFSLDEGIDASMLREQSSDEVRINPRNDRGFVNFVSFFVALLLVLVAFIKWYQARNLNDFLRLDNMFSPRNKDENILRSKVITSGNSVFFIFFALLSSELIVLISELLQSQHYSFWYYLGQWGIWFLYVSIFLIAKYLLISFFIYVFNISSFFGFHVINYMRISIFFAAIWTVALLFIIWFDGQLNMVHWVISSIVVSMILRTIVLFLKLINTANYRLFHLFSYLCATEILPFFWLILLASYLF